MRLDLFLKKTSLIKRRTIAKELVLRGHIQINGKVGKPSSEVKNDDLIHLELGNRTVEVKAVIEIKNNKEVPSFTLVKNENVDAI